MATFVGLWNARAIEGKETHILLHATNKGVACKRRVNNHGLVFFG